MAEKTKAPKQKEEKKVPQKSVKGFYKFISDAWKHPSEEFVKERRKKMIDWRAAERIHRIDKPIRLDRARALGYKAKKGFIVFRVTLERGGRKKPRPRTKRRSKRFSIKKILRMNYQWIAERRV